MAAGAQTRTTGFRTALAVHIAQCLKAFGRGNEAVSALTGTINLMETFQPNSGPGEQPRSGRGAPPP